MSGRGARAERRRVQAERGRSGAESGRSGAEHGQSGAVMSSGSERDGGKSRERKSGLKRLGWSCWRPAASVSRVHKS